MSTINAYGHGTGTITIGGNNVLTRRHAKRIVRLWKIRNFFKQGWRELPLELYILLLPVLQRLIPGLNCSYGTCYAKKWDGALGCWIDYGKIGRHLKTTAGKNYIAGCFNNTNEPELFKFHGFGTGVGAPAVGDTALGTEFTTQYNPDNTRPTGSQSVSTNVYTTIGTFTPDANCSPTEWGLFTATSAGTLLDRQTFTAIPLSTSTSDSLQITYNYTEA